MSELDLKEYLNVLIKLKHQVHTLDQYLEEHLQYTILCQREEENPVDQNTPISEMRLRFAHGVVRHTQTENLISELVALQDLINAWFKVIEGGVS